MQCAEERWVRSFTGTPCLYTSVVGYCHLQAHRGYVTKMLLKSHDCIKKECPFLQKIDSQYWETRQRHEIQKCERRTLREKRRHDILARDAAIHGIFSQNPHICVTAIREEGKALVIYYIYDQYVDLSDMLRSARKVCNRSIRLKAVRTSNLIIDKLIRKRHCASETENAIGS